MIKFLLLDFLDVSHSTEFYERKKMLLPALVPEILKSKKCVKYANEMTDDVTHSTQYYINCMIELPWPICSADH